LKGKRTKTLSLNDASPRPAETREIQTKEWIETIFTLCLKKIFYLIVSSKRPLGRLCRISKCFGIHAMPGPPFRPATALLRNTILLHNEYFQWIMDNFKFLKPATRPQTPGTSR
jgi:hypothetical protein